VTEQLNQPIHAFLNIWRHPRRVMRALIDRGNMTLAFVFASVSGIVNAFEFVQTSELDDALTNEAVKAAVTIGAGIVSGIIFYLLLSVLFMFFGRWLGGKGQFRELGVAVGWAMLPFIGTFIIAMIEYGLYGSAYLAGGQSLADAQAAYSTLSLILLVVKLFFSVYAIVFLVAGLAEAHRLTLSQGMGVLLIFVVLYFIFWIAVQALSVDI